MGAVWGDDATQGQAIARKGGIHPIGHPTHARPTGRRGQPAQANGRVRPPHGGHSSHHGTVGKDAVKNAVDFVPRQTVSTGIELCGRDVLERDTQLPVAPLEPFDFASAERTLAIIEKSKAPCCGRRVGMRSSRLLGAAGDRDFVLHRVDPQEMRLHGIASSPTTRFLENSTAPANPFFRLVQKYTTGRASVSHRGLLELCTAVVLDTHCGMSGSPTIVDDSSPMRTIAKPVAACRAPAWRRGP